MLNRLKIAQLLPSISRSLLSAYDQEITLGMKLWNLCKDDPHLSTIVSQLKTKWDIPQWAGALSVLHSYNPITRYCVFGVDGSQIYPDRHRGLPCYLINIGSVVIQYDTKSIVLFESEPYIFAHSTDARVLFSAPELVNGERTEYEFKKALQLARSVVALQAMPDRPTFLFDGALIFWHLDKYDIEIRNRFLASYIMLCEQLYQERVLYAGYISLPKSKELINILRSVAQREGIDFEGLYMVDADIMTQVLQPYESSIFFAHQSDIVSSYPEHLRPHFCYINTGSEIARIELPAWIAQNDSLRNQLLSVIIDQCKKGYGYPVVLAEAHEQAVVTTADREFFYELLLNQERSRAHIFNSSKLMKKKHRTY
jgi:hypothetical protein